MSVDLNNFLTNNLPHQSQIAREEEWKGVEEQALDLSAQWLMGFEVQYQGDPRHKSALSSYIAAKMMFILEELSQDRKKLEYECASRKVLAAKEAQVIERINNVVSSVLLEDESHSGKYLNVFKPQIAAEWVQKRLEREMNYQPPGFLEDMKTMARCFGRSPKETEIKLKEPQYKDFILHD